MQTSGPTLAHWSKTIPFTGGWFLGNSHGFFILSGQNLSEIEAGWRTEDKELIFLNTVLIPYPSQPSAFFFFFTSIAHLHINVRFCNTLGTTMSVWMSQNTHYQIVKESSFPTNIYFWKKNCKCTWLLIIFFHKYLTPLKATI